MNSKKEALSYIDNILVVILGILFFAFPLAFTSQMTDAFALPKQVIIMGAVALSLILLAVRMVIIGKVQIKSTPFDLPLFIFTLVVFGSAIFAVNRYDALINFVPLLFGVLLYFIMVNSLKKETAVLVSVSSLVLGASLSAIISVLSYFKLYILPSADVQFQTFTTLGAMLDQAIYFALVMPLAGYIAWPMVAKRMGRHSRGNVEAMAVEGKNQDLFAGAFAAGFVILLIGLGVSLFMLATIARPIILPFETGFQTAFAAISQDTGRVLKSFLLGSGYGTYITDFTRFKPAAYNLNEQLWSFTFFRSSSYALELLTTTGVLGLLSFLFIAYRFFKEKTMFLPLILAFIAAILLPFSFTIQLLFFVLLGLFASLRALSNPRAYPDLEFYFVALKKGILVAVPEGHAQPHDAASHKGYARILPFLMAAVVVVFVGMIGYMAGRYVLSDLALQRSLVAFSQNDAQRTYDQQIQAINLFPYRDTNHRVFSQLNLTLANALASAQPQGQQIDQAVQNDILTLIQQSINAGRNAVTVSPQTALNWNNLSSIYRSLINFGQNADQFAVVTNQEAIRLDPANPQQYINLGGIYYQLGLWSEAQNQFQLAIQLKPDYANAYYNLGHALEQQGELATALNAYLVVRNLVANDQQSLQQINSEIEALQAKVNEQPDENQAANVNPSGNQEPLNVNEPENQLPERDPEVEIPGPSASPSPTRGATPTPEEE